MYNQYSILIFADPFAAFEAEYSNTNFRPRDEQADLLADSPYGAVSPATRCIKDYVDICMFPCMCDLVFSKHILRSILQALTFKNSH